MAKKSEQVYRELLYRFVEKKENRFTQLALAKKLGVSTSTINNALKPVARMGAVEIKKMSFRIVDYKKILFYWASMRNLEKDILYSTRAETSVSEIEKGMPPEVVYTCYSAYKFRFEDVAADYSEVYIYAGEDMLNELKRRFPQRKDPANLFILRLDNALKAASENSLAPLGQVFVDLWNLKTWYAGNFANALGKKIGDMLGVLE